jgi:hypothetical protein
MKRHVLIVTAAAALGAATFPMQVSAHDEPVIGVIGGAAAGGLIGGPPGAVAGAIVGAIAGAHVAHESDHGHRHVHRHVGYYTEEAPTVRYVETVRYVQPAHCAPQAVYYRPARVTHVETYPKYTRTSAATKTKVKKVCRYEKVKAVNTASVARRPVG